MKLIIIGFALLALLACSTTPNVIPDGCENSLIYKYIPNPSQAGMLLQFGNLAAMDADLYTPEQALKVIGDIREKLNSPSLTYAVLAAFTTVKVAPYVQVLGPLVGDFSKYDILIDECDRDLLFAHLDDQQALVEMRMESGTW